MEELKIEKEIAEEISKTFHSAEVTVKREKRVVVKLRDDLITPFLSYAKNNMNFIHLAHISCVDWLEDNKFELIYSLLNYDNKVMILAKTYIDRENPEFVSHTNYWDQAETYEREMREMYGINFKGNKRLTEFILEDWQGIPPMRRDFDTVKFSQDTFYNRPGRENAQDVRTTVTKKSGEEIPEIGKDYTVRNL
ncbi:MAG: NADH-quinone oxidoreductase subunit C [Chlorobi bacterium]|nr:NADH-quinone oxidoreductase subunit C [Chlorobiota bacterium]